MKIITRYLIKELLVSLVCCLIVFISLYIIVDLFGLLNKIVENNVSFLLVLNYYRYLIPVIFVQMCPLAILLSVLFTLSNFSHRNELTAVHASGISIYRIITPFLLISILVALINFHINEWSVPRAARHAYLLKQTKIKRTHQHIWRNIPYYGTDGRLFYLKLINLQDNTIEGVRITKYHEEKNKSSQVEAKTALWNTDQWVLEQASLRIFNPSGEMKEMIKAEKIVVASDSSSWTLFNGVIRHYQPEGTSIEEPFKEIVRYLFPLKETPQELAQKQRKADEMSRQELLARIKQLQGTGFVPRKELIDFHAKLALPLANIVVVLVGIPFAVRAKRGGKLTGFGKAIGIGLIYYTFTATGQSLAVSVLPPLIGVWMANILFIIMGVVLLYHCPT